ncbi:hypothetical protein EKD04_008360 [Chloroflexales bacterium ZM16-3]|nr:hypothetical protein [Chloroflexales bacterium ZM16-3]
MHPWTVGEVATSILEQRVQGLRSCRQIYVDLVILEERIAGRMPPVEGIRLVREPRDS